MEEYAIGVRFYDRGYWSKSYTYLWHEPVKPGALALVPKDKFYSVGKVVSCTQEFVKNPLIRYKNLATVIEGIE